MNFHRGNLPVGSIIESKRHRSGLIHVDICGTGAVIGRVLRRDGSVGRREVVLNLADVRAVHLGLPLED
jgi:hypothetical protein